MESELSCRQALPIFLKLHMVFKLLFHLHLQLSSSFFTTLDYPHLFWVGEQDWIWRIISWNTGLGGLAIWPKPHSKENRSWNESWNWDYWSERNYHEALANEHASAWKQATIELRARQLQKVKRCGENISTKSTKIIISDFGFLWKILQIKDKLL